MPLKYLISSASLLVCRYIMVATILIVLQDGVGLAMCKMYWRNQSQSQKYFIHLGIEIYSYEDLYPRRSSRGVSDISPRPTFYQNYLAVRNTADVTGGKPIAD
jgi:hypothetical protein